MLNFTESADWYRAINLKERISLLSKLSGLETLENMPDLELAQDRLKKWRNFSPLKKDKIFAQWLNLEGITEQDLLYLLGQSNDILKQCYESTPEWLKTIFRAFTYQNEGKIGLPVKLPKLIQDESIIGFLDVIKPLIDECCETLNKAIQQLSNEYKELPFDPNTIKDILLINILPDLLMELIQTMVKKCDELRQKGLLKGDTSKQRYEYFLDYMRQKDQALALLQEYPVLGRRLIIILNNWVKFSIETLERLCRDWINIKNVFTPEKDPGIIILDKESSVGDSHKSGQVITLTFSSGFKLLYKPRSLSMDLHFQQLLEWLNNKGIKPEFRTLKVLDCSSYGWMEFVTFQSCSSENEITNFYYRQGGNLALLYILYGVDFHSENLIAAGEHPILVDLETLFSQPDENNSNNKAAKYLQESVLRTGLLPMQIFGNNQHKGIDFSGLAGLSGQLTPYPLPYLELSGTDEIHIVRKQLRYEEENTHRPKLNGKDVILWDYIDTIVKGFTDVYQILQKNTAALISSDGLDGLITRFAKDEVRIILRSTRDYGVLLTESSNPNMLRNAIACEWLFDNLWKKTEDYPFLLKVIASERESLLEGFIPRFITHPDSTDLWSDDKKCVPNFFTKPVIDFVKTRLQNLSDEDLKKQIWLIRASFITLVEDTENVKPKSYKFNLNNNKTIDNKSLIKTATAIGDCLANLAITYQNKASWISLQVGNLNNYYISPSKLDLYDGLPGTTLFLAYLGYITNQLVYTELAKQAMENIRQQIKQPKNKELQNVGGYGGLSGIIYLLTHLAKLWNDPSLITEAVEIAKQLPFLIEKDNRFDLIYGSAGCITSLMNLYKFVVNPQDLEQIKSIIIQSGKHLVSKIEITPEGKGWTTIPGKKPPLGMSHGVAGIAWALLELSSFTKDSNFADLAQEALSYERSFFSPLMGNWPDINRDDTDEKFRVTWCHGATGIGIARLLSVEHLSTDKLIDQEISIAVKTVINNGFGNNHSLCHGDLGNLDFLLQVIEKQPNYKIHNQVQNIASVIFNNIDKQGWLCGTPLSAESPGLMVGIAGIGYQLLRLASSSVVPSILCLAPPKI
ncbi:MAG: type 2 lantipeptide synthetase LanM [Acidobacteria bacterium]|nr:type 2 lantipeptide synthetase LanM [Acidobacteriota bacterium]